MPRRRRSFAAASSLPIALCCALLAGPARTAAAQAAAASTYSRDPGTATLLGIVFPGAGHYYAGEPGRGALFTAGTLLSFGIAGATWASQCYSFGETSPCDQGMSTAGAFVLVGAGIWLVGAVDAHNAVHRESARHARFSVLPTLVPTDRAHGSRLLALRATARLTL